MSQVGSATCKRENAKKREWHLNSFSRAILSRASPDFQKIIRVTVEKTTFSGRLFHCVLSRAKLLDMLSQFNPLSKYGRKSSFDHRLQQRYRQSVCKDIR